MKETATSGKILINGIWVDVPSTVPVINPACHNETVGRVGYCDKKDVLNAVSAASTSLEDWATTDPESRAARIKVAAGALSDCAASLVELFVKESGKTLSEAERDIQRAIKIMELVASELPSWSAPELIEKEQSVWLRKRARGVTAVISPWNSPVFLSFRRFVPAIAGGNTIVLKPASYCPLTVLECFRIIQPYFPAGVLNLVTGKGEKVGQALVADPRIATVSFTGGTETGRNIIQTSASNIKKLLLELGGNDPAVVLKDAILNDQNIQRMTQSILRSAGQVCIAIKRIYVHESRREELLEKLASSFARIVVGNPLRKETTMGPLNNMDQFRVVNSLLESSRQSGLAVRTLGQKLDPDSWNSGFFILPSIVANAGHRDEITRCEQFGPVIPIISFDDNAQAIKWSNDTDYGLRASVWTSNRHEAERLAQLIHAGAIFHNNHGIFKDLHVEFPGLKQSGLNTESRHLGLDHFSDAYGLAD